MLGCYQIKMQANVAYFIKNLITTSLINKGEMITESLVHEMSEIII